MNFFLYKKGVGVLPYTKGQYDRQRTALMGDGWRPATHEEVVSRYPELKVVKEKKKESKPKATPHKKIEAEN